MAAYSETSGFVERDEGETRRKGKITFKTTPEDPIVVVAGCTRIMLEDRILEMAEKISGEAGYGESFEHWAIPDIKWVNGVPGCGKTTWVIENFDQENDIVVTTTRQAMTDLREKLTLKGRSNVQNRVRTMASILVNGLKEPEKCCRLIVDEALMNHFGAIVMAFRITGVSEALLIGDKNQLPYIERNNLFRLVYSQPNSVATIDHELLCTHRNPMDVAFALGEIYSGICSSKARVRSLKVKTYGSETIPNSRNTLYLVHTQAEKELLVSQGYGLEAGSKTLTIHEAQALTSEKVVIVRAATKHLQLHSSVPHAVVAISRHTDECIYFTSNCEGDAVARLIRRAETATTHAIWDYNLKMAMRNRNKAIIEAMLGGQGSGVRH